MFSVDGAHTAAATRTDLGNAAACLTEGGVLVIDDVFNSDWPGVSEGFHSFMSASDQQLLPFVIAYNKVQYPVFHVIPHSLFEPTSYRTGVK